MRGALGGSVLAAGLLVSACAGSAEEPPPKTAEDLYREAEVLLEGSRVLFFLESVDYPRAIAGFQAIIDEFPFSEFATLSELKIGDAYFDQRDFAQASSFYQEFVELHPKHPKVPYALLRNGECAFAQILEPDQDQGKTRDAIEQFNALIDRYPGIPEVERARELRDEAVNDLAVSEALVGDFYFGSEKYHAAVPRYRDALEQAPRHTGYRRTQVRLGMALRRVGQVEEGDRILKAVLPDPEVDDDVREEAEDELGYRVAIDVPAKAAGGGFRLWPFGGGDRAEETPEPEPAEGVAFEVNAPPSDASPETEEVEDSGSRWFWPF